MQLENRIRVKFGAEMLQSIGLMFPDVQEDEYSSTQSPEEAGIGTSQVNIVPVTH